MYALVKILTTISTHKFDYSNSIFNTLHFNMCSIYRPLSFLNSSIKSKRFIYHLKQLLNINLMHQKVI